MQFSYSVTLKCIDLILSGALLLVCDIIPCTGYLDNVDSMSYAYLPNVDNINILQYQKKNTFVNITTDLIMKVFKYRGSVRFVVADTSFPRLSFLLDSLHFTSGNKYCQFFSLKRWAHFIHFRKCLPKFQV